jgi:hypothetical protein
MSKKIIEDEDTNSVECVNISSETLKFEIDGVRYKLGPRDRVHLHKNYALPRAMQPGRDPVPSAVALLTSHKVLPVTDKRAMAALGIRSARHQEASE